MKQMSLSHLGQKALILAGLMGSLALAGCGGGSGITALPGGGRDYDSAPRRPVKHSEALDYSKNFTVHGIDVSKYQGNIDWQAVASSGTQFAWIKATEGGDHVDQKFMQNWEGAKAAGVLIALNRQERGNGELSAIQEVERDFGIPVISIVSLNQVLEFLADDPQLKQHLPAVEAYRAQYGV